MPAEFEVFSRFAMFGKLCTNKACLRDPHSRTTVATEIRTLFRCWQLGDRLLAVNFKDAVHDAILQVMLDSGLTGMRMDSGAAGMRKLREELYIITAGPDSLRRFVVDLAVWEWTKEDFAKLWERTHSHDFAERSVKDAWVEFLKDLGVRLGEVPAQERKGRPPYEEMDCRYHEHVAAGKPCYKTLI